jgi:hypothetical protein
MIWKFSSNWKDSETRSESREYGQVLSEVLFYMWAYEMRCDAPFQACIIIVLTPCASSNTREAENGWCNRSKPDVNRKQLLWREEILLEAASSKLGAGSRAIGRPLQAISSAKLTPEEISVMVSDSEGLSNPRESSGKVARVVSKAAFGFHPSFSFQRSIFILVWCRKLRLVMR